MADSKIVNSRMVNGWNIEHKNGFWTATNSRGQVKKTHSDEGTVLTWALSNNASK